MATTIPNSTAAASGPACAICTAEYANIPNPTLIISILAPNASNADVIAVNFFVPPDIDDNIETILTLKAVTTPTNPANTAIAVGPASATATADRAKR